MYHYRGSRDWPHTRCRAVKHACPFGQPRCHWYSLLCSPAIRPVVHLSMLQKIICRPGLNSQSRTAQPVLRRPGAMHIWLALYGAARVVIGQPHVDITFDSSSITLGEVLEKLIVLYPRA